MIYPTLTAAAKQRIEIDNKFFLSITVSQLKKLLEWNFGIASIHRMFLWHFQAAISCLLGQLIANARPRSWNMRGTGTWFHQIKHLGALIPAFRFVLSRRLLHVRTSFVLYKSSKNVEIGL